MKFCPRCGSPLDGSPKFCMICGEDLLRYHNNTEPEKAEPGDTVSEDGEPEHSEPGQREKDHISLKILPLVATVVIAFIIIFGIGMFHYDKNAWQTLRDTVVSTISHSQSESDGTVDDTDDTDTSAGDIDTSADDADTSADDMDTAGDVTIKLISSADTAACQQIEENYLDDILENIYAALEDPITTCTQDWYQDGLYDVTEQLTQPAVWEIQDGVYLSIYNWTTCGFDFNGFIGIYYGSLDEDLQRSGTGLWASFYDDDFYSDETEFQWLENYSYNGGWADDKPNGTGNSILTRRIYYEDEDEILLYGNIAYELESDFTDGIPDGTGILKLTEFIDGFVYTGECKVIADFGEFADIVTYDGHDYAAAVDMFSEEGYDAGCIYISAGDLSLLSVVQ